MKRISRAVLRDCEEGKCCGAAGSPHQLGEKMGLALVINPSNGLRSTSDFGLHIIFRFVP